MPRTVSLDNEMKIAKEQQKRGFKLQIIIIIAICLVPAFAIFRDAGASAFHWQNDRLTLTYPDNSTIEMLYDDVTAIEYRETFDFGTPVTGGTEDQCKYGLWNNEEFGDYQACCHVDIASCIIFTTSDTHFVISFESPETTLALYESARTTLIDGGYITE